MKRPIESSQRKMRQVNIVVNAAGTAVTGPDRNQVSLADTGTGVKTITLNTPFFDADSIVVQVTPGTAASVAQYSITNKSTIVVYTFDAVTPHAAQDAICSITITGSDAQSGF